jgi:DNA invertase Pin-like site-specific DNA recombinase
MRAIELIRVSTPGQFTDDRYGVARQEDAIAMGRKHHGLTIFRTAKVQESGKYIMEDSDFKAIVADLEAGRADGVLVAEQSRLVRPENFDAFTVFGIFLHKMIWTPTAAIDPCTKEGAMLLGVTGLMSGIDLTLMKERMLGARESMRKQGAAGSGGQAIPRGVIYTKIKGQKIGLWSYAPEYAPKVREAYRMLIEDDAPYQAIAVTLDVCERTAHNTLQNPIWLGYRRRDKESQTAPVRVVANRRTPLKPGEKIRRYRPTRPLAEPEWVETNLLSEPLIAREIFDRAKRIIAGRRAHHKRDKRSANTLIPGDMVRCACGDHYYHKSDKRGYDRMYCASRHPARKRRSKASRGAPRPAACPAASFRRDHLESALEQMFAYALTGQLILETLDQLGKASRRAPARARSIDQELKTLDAAHARGYRQYTFGKVTEAQWDALRSEIEAKRQALLAARPEPVAVLYDGKALAREVAAIFAEYANLLLAQKRELLRRAVKEIHMSSDAEILGVTVSGGFLGSLEGWANSGKCSQAYSQVSPPDLQFTFARPIAVKAAA